MQKNGIPITSLNQIFIKIFCWHNTKCYSLGTVYLSSSHTSKNRVCKISKLFIQGMAHNGVWYKIGKEILCSSGWWIKKECHARIKHGIMKWPIGRMTELLQNNEKTNWETEEN